MKRRIYPSILACVITKQCTAECKMCCFQCSPRETAKLSKERVEQLIDDAGKHIEIETIGFSGGEPFLEFENLLEFIDRAKRYRKNVICTTNGFWGTSLGHALEIVEKVKSAGLDRLSLSVDHFHGEFVSYDKIHNILKACNQKSLAVDVGSVITKSTSRLVGIFDEFSEEMVNVPHYIAACLPVGNALEKIEESDYIYDDFIFERSNRCFETNYFAVFSNGDVYPCCSQAGATKPLYIGNIEKMDLDELTKKYNANMNIRILNRDGLNWYLEIAKKLDYKALLEKKYVNKCDLCRTIFSDQIFMKLVEPYLEIEKNIIYQKYLENMSKNGAV